ncbi:hypothetical protein [Haliangium sp.]|uniref:hypothetical protein n=1 Tax=Haliangium sp. TaxID=2663208 RepID=UPI003D0E1FDB
MQELQDQQPTPSNGQYIPGSALDPVLSTVRAANHLIGVYERHFAGRSRASRDARCLGELLERLLDCQHRLESLPDAATRERAADSLATVERQALMLEDECTHILNARQVQAPAERAALLATRINEQFALYRTHFAGQSRLSRRPRLLQRIINNLDDIQAELDDKALLELDDDGTSEANRKLVAEELPRLRRELGLIELEHQAASVTERAAALGVAANTELRAYNLYFAGQDRATREPERLLSICDRLTEIEWQFLDMIGQYHSEAITRSLDAVQVCLDLYLSEYEQILAIRSTAAPTPDDAAA